MFRNPSDPDAVVKKHIKLLHEFNEVKDVAQGLLGMVNSSLYPISIVIFALCYGGQPDEVHTISPTFAQRRMGPKFGAPECQSCCVPPFSSIGWF